MVLKLAGTYDSPSFQLPATILAELNLPFTHLPIDFKKQETKLPQNVAYHPFGQVPFLIDTSVEPLIPGTSPEGEGFVMYECRAIAKYLAGKYGEEGGKRLVPDGRDLREVALFDQAASVEQNAFLPAAIGACVEAVWKPV